MRFLLTAFIAGESLLLFLPQLPNESLWFWLLTSLGFCLLLIAFFSLIKRQALNKISFCILVYILFALGFTWSGYLTHKRIKNDLPQNLEGVPLLVEGVVDGLPSQGTQSLRFSMTVESVLSDDELIQIDLQYFPKRLSLGWYPGWRGETVVPEIKPGQRWRLPVVLKRAHGLMNPHGFDFERWMFQQNLGATGSVKAHAKGLQGWSALHYAATNGHVQMMRLLLDNNAYLDAEAPNGNTPLMMAAQAGHSPKISTVCATSA